jgi:hypothetical protein
MAHNPYHGWIPISGYDPEVIRRISRRRVGQSLPQLEALLASDNDLMVPFPPEWVNAINQRTQVQLPQMALIIDRTAVVGIVEAIRDRVLNWAIELEQAGILGEGLSFTLDERKRAHEGAMTINIGTVGSFVGNLGSGNLSRDISSNALPLSDLQSLLEQLSAAQSQLVQAGAEEVALSKALRTLEMKLARGQQDQTGLTGALVDVRNAISGAAGNLVATGALAMLSKLLGG